MFRSKFNVTYRMYDNPYKEPYNVMNSKVFRVPIIGETVIFRCYGDHVCTVVDVITVECHNPENNYYEIKLNRVG